MNDPATLAADPAIAAADASTVAASSDNGASQTDEQILGITENDAQVQTAETATETQSTETQQTAEPQEPAWRKEAEEEGLFLTEAPAELKALFADPKIGKLVQSAWDSRQTAQAYREFIPTLKEARTVREAFPGGLEEMQRTIAEARESQLTDLAFYSKNPQMQGQLAERLYGEDKDAFVGQLRASTKFLAENDPETYASLALEVGPQFLQSERFPEFVDAAENVVRANKGDDAIALLQELIGWSDKKGLRGETRQRLHPEQQRFNRERQQFDKERNEARQATWTNVRMSADAAMRTQIQQHITQKLDALLPASFKIDPGTKKSLQDKIFSELDARLKSDLSLVQPYEAIKARVLNSGRTSDGDQRELIGLVVNRAQQLFHIVARSVVNEWTRNVVAASRATNQRRDTAAQRRDISAGGAASSRPSRITQKDINEGGRLSRMSDMDILNS